MGTKRLARTIIEGGRARHNQWERRHSNREARTFERRYERRLENDPEYWDDHVEPERELVYAWPYDKLGAVRRWLRAQRGRRWDDVYAEIRARFDTRTIAGHHIVFGHMIAEVDFGHVHDRPWWPRLHVDQAGRLQLGAGRPHVVSKNRRVTTPPCRLSRWLGERRVGRRGASWYWFAQVARARAQDPPAYRQTARLDDEAVRVWESFSEAERETLTLFFDEDGRRLAGPPGRARRGRRG